jgi:hypothetical protein
MIQDINFKILETKDVLEMLPYFKATRLHLSDYSAAFKIMWQKHFTLQFAYVANCVVFCENWQGRTYFHYPMELRGGDAQKAIDEIEEYCRQKHIRMHFTCIPRKKLLELIDRYGMELRITNHRRWKDYFYNAKDFVTYAGGKFSGQRNHVNKFKKLYPNYKFVRLTSVDVPKIKNFLSKYEVRQLSKGTLMAKEELESVYMLLPYIDEFDFKAGGLEVDGELIAISIGEQCGDQLIIHVEKGLVGYEGVYPTMAQEFAKAFVTDGIIYINREDDAGDAGLRKSKMQYNPIFLVDKYDIFPRRVIERITHTPHLRSERLVIKEISDSDAEDLYALEMYEERNKLWGWDWREHTEDKAPTPQFFIEGWKEDFKNSEEMPMGIYLDNKFIGEVVLHNFGYRNDCEIGMRLLPQYEGQGYAQEAVRTVMDYAFYDLNMETIFAKCHKINERSKNTLTSVGLKQYAEDETFYYFRKTASM